jgi:hypothetical protein
MVLLLHEISLVPQPLLMRIARAAEYPECRRISGERHSINSAHRHHEHSNSGRWQANCREVLRRLSRSIGTPSAA